jgi:hypothetical protein
VQEFPRKGALPKVICGLFGVMIVLHWKSALAILDLLFEASA